MHVLNARLGREAVLRQADATAAQIGPICSWWPSQSHTGSAARRGHCPAVSFSVRGRGGRRGLDHSQLRAAAQAAPKRSGCRDAVARRRGRGAAVGARRGVVARRQEGIVAGEQIGRGALPVDGEVVDYRPWRGGVLQLVLGVSISSRRRAWARTAPGRDEAHAAAGHAAQHPEAQSRARTRRAPADQRLGVVVAGRG